MVIIFLFIISSLSVLAYSIEQERPGVFDLSQGGEKVVLSPWFGEEDQQMIRSRRLARIGSESHPLRGGVGEGV